MRFSLPTVGLALAGMLTCATARATANPQITAETSPTSEVTAEVIPVLTLDRCVEIALSTNPTIRVADLDITRVDYSRKDALAQLLPTVAFGGSYNRMLAKQVAYMDFDMGALGGADGGEGDETTKPAQTQKKGSGDGIKMGRDNSYQVGFNASVPLIAPQLWAQLKLTDSQIAQSVEQARASRLDMVNQVNSAYYRLLLAHDSKKSSRRATTWLP